MCAPKKYRPISPMNTDAKNTQRNTSKPNSKMYQKDHPSQPSGIYSRGARMV